MNTNRDMITDIMCEGLSDPANQRILINAIYEEPDPVKLNIEMQILWSFFNANIERIRYFYQQRNNCKSSNDRH